MLLYRHTSRAVQFLSMDSGSIPMIMSRTYPFELYNMLSIMVEWPSPNLLGSLEQLGYVDLGYFPVEHDHLIVHKERIEAAIGDLCAALERMAHHLHGEEFYLSNCVYC